MSKFPLYTVDYITQVMSLRKPQKESLVRLDSILDSLNLNKNINLKAALALVNSLYGTCTDFEHPFMSLAFALATGVGKTRLMGAFITYLYTQHNIRNFFVVAPGTTVFEKLKKDLGYPGSEKYVFDGLGCFSVSPVLITDDDYYTKQLFDSGINIYVYNIDKFNKESSRMNQVSETLGESFIEKLSKLEDLVVIMDESHHYRANKGLAALNDLKPLLGLELTATPKYNDGSKQINFKNVVYEYPLSEAIADGYTRTPFALTRADIPEGAFTDEQMDKLMISDGIRCHERTRRILKQYSEQNNKKLVKPFMLIVCKDTDHANDIFKYVTSEDFKEGYYSDKTIIVHSKQKGAESEENTNRLLAVESNEEPTEIVIHVNKLKEGWDVNNLYTIVPLRAATSDILKEQMVGRGLRLPYGVRTGNKDIDAVMLTAHDKFREILEAAQRGDSIFKAGNVIKIEDLEKTKTVIPQYTLDLFPDEEKEEVFKSTNIKRTAETETLIDKTVEVIESVISQEINNSDDFVLDNKSKIIVKAKVQEKLEKDKDIAKIYYEYKDPLDLWVEEKSEKTYKKIKNNSIPIPQIKITDRGVDEFNFIDFDLDLSDFNYSPIEDKVVIQNIINQSDQEIINGSEIDLNINPKKTILELLREKPEIDYEKHGELIRKLIIQFCSFYEEKYGTIGMRNIVLMNKKEISTKIYMQMMLDGHFYCENTLLKEEISFVMNTNRPTHYDISVECDLYDNFKDKTEGSIKSVLFKGIKKGVFSSAKFDSEQELILARICERDGTVENWLRPDPKEFNITYNHGKRYEPDFVIETKDIIYLTEVKDARKLNDVDVLAKQARGVHYCTLASEYGKANGYKEWRYMIIPHDKILASSSFSNLSSLYVKNEGHVYEMNKDDGTLKAADNYK